MLQIMNGSPIAVDDYYIQHKADGVDELHFEVTLFDPVYPELLEETQILETTEQQLYVIKSVSAGKNTAKIGCRLDLADWEGQIELNYNRSGTAAQFLRGYEPDDWTVTEETEHAERKTIEMKGPTPLEVALQMQEDFECAVRFNTKTKTARLVWPKEIQPSNAYAVDTVNLRQPPEYKGRSDELYTRLYPVGKDGLTIESVNGGVPYVENFTYTDRVICKVWRDNRFTIAQELKDEALRMLDTACQPERSWKLAMIDLHRLNPDKWPDLKLELFTVFRLIDRFKGVSANVQICEDRVYPYYPEKNEITVSTVMRSVQRTLSSLYKAIYDPNSGFQQQLDWR